MENETVKLPSQPCGHLSQVYCSNQKKVEHHFMHSKGSRSQMTAYPLSRTLLELQNPFFLGAWSLAGNRLMFLPRRDQQARMIAQIEKCNIELLCMNLS